MYRNLQLPTGYSRDSFLKWQGTAIVSPSNAGETVHDLSGQTLHVNVRPPGDGKVTFILSIKCKLKQPNAQINKLRGTFVAKTIEEDDFNFGVEWSYYFSQSKVRFERENRFMGSSPNSAVHRGNTPLQGWFQDYVSKDQETEQDRPIVMADGWLKLAPITDPGSSLRIGGGYAGATAQYQSLPQMVVEGDSWKLGTFGVDLNVLPPEKRSAPVDLGVDPRKFQLLVTYEKEKGSQLNELTAKSRQELNNWVQLILNSKLEPLLKAKLITIHLRGHASPTGNPDDDDNLSTVRREVIQKFLTRHLGSDVKFEWEDQGHLLYAPIHPRPKNLDKAYESYRNVGIFIEESEVREAVSRPSVVSTN